MAKNYDEKECEICGVWFTPHTAHTKYCPECRNHWIRNVGTLKSRYPVTFRYMALE